MEELRVDGAHAGHFLVVKMESSLALGHFVQVIVCLKLSQPDLVLFQQLNEQGTKRHRPSRA